MTLMAPLLKVQSRLKANGVRLIFCRLNAEFCMNYSILYRVPGWVIEQQGALKTKPKKILINWILLVEMQKVLYCAESAEGVFLIYLCIFLCVVGRYTGNFAFFSRWMNKFKFKLIGCKKKKSNNFNMYSHTVLSSNSFSLQIFVTCVGIGSGWLTPSPPLGISLYYFRINLYRSLLWLVAHLLT